MQPPGSPDSGTPIPPTLRHQLEVEMRADLSAVRIHSDHTPTMLGAQAFTSGSDIHFRPGVYNAHSPAGRELLGHELTHVVQQQGTRPATPPAR
jgi:hypothetical protein